MWAWWFSETTKGGILDFLLRFVTTIIRFAHIVFISAVSKFESFQRCSYLASGADLWDSWKWDFIKYFQTVGSAFEHKGQAIGTFEHGEAVEDSAATL